MFVQTGGKYANGTLDMEASNFSPKNPKLITCRIRIGGSLFKVKDYNLGLVLGLCTKNSRPVYCSGWRRNMRTGPWTWTWPWRPLGASRRSSNRSSQSSNFRYFQPPFADQDPGSDLRPIFKKCISKISSRQKKYLYRFSLSFKQCCGSVTKS